MGKNRENFEVERDRNYVTEYYLKGFSTRAIAKKIGDQVGNGYSISHPTVAADVKFLLKQWSKERIHQITDQKLIELQKIDRLEQTYWDAWEKSIENTKRKTQKLKGTIKGKEADYRELTETEIIEFGEPRYLQGIERCIDKRCKLLGLDAPVKMETQDNSFIAFLMNTL